MIDLGKEMAWVTFLHDGWQTKWYPVRMCLVIIWNLMLPLWTIAVLSSTKRVIGFTSVLPKLLR